MALAGGLALVAPIRGELPPLTFALATLALLLATLAARRHRVEYGYAAGAALIAAGLCQVYDWGFHQPQWYVLPAGLYLLALAARRELALARWDDAATAATAVLRDPRKAPVLDPHVGDLLADAYVANEEVHRVTVNGWRSLRTGPSTRW